VKRRIGYMPENNPLPEDLRVRDYLHWRGQLKELSRRKRRERVESVLDLCDLERAQTRILGKLSKGFRQRVGVADAILAEPDVVIMDEPTIGLDPHQIITMRDLISSLRGRHSVIISSHILPEIEMTCDRVIIINNGHIVASGTPDQLRREFVDRTTYDLEVRGDHAIIEQVLDRVDPKRKIERPTETADKDGFYKLMVHMKADRHHGEDILTALGTAQGVRLRALTCRRPTLEEVFLAATRRSWETVTPLSNPLPPQTISRTARNRAADDASARSES
jgi:ABC-2 type transport system ATP-binding protein